ncbi:helicase HerA-like domain-containing protein [Geodermatophilus sp. SYSU D00684]
MSQRLGAALAAHIRRMPGGAAKFVLVEGVPVSLAEGMAGAWGDDLPPLAVVSAEPGRFGPYALADTSGTALRNRRGEAGARGVVLVLCEGEQVPDRQSLNLFESVSPSVLLEGPAGLGLLAQQQPAVALDGPARAVRDAIARAGIASRPSAAAVASYLDRLAAGEPPLQALPVLGAFRDLSAGDRVEGDRIGDNLALAARRTSEDLLRPAAYPDLRRRTETVLARRPGLRGDKGAITVAADEVMRALQVGDDRLLTLLQYDEAKEILEQKSQDLVGAVTAALNDYQNGLPPEGQAAALPWDNYLRRAQSLRRAAEQKQAAQELLDLDEAQRRAIFPRTTRTKLERLLRDKAINGSNPSCPEAALVKATQQLGGLIHRVQVLSPLPPASQANNRSGAGRVLTLACARLRLGALMRRWDRTGGEIDGLLLQRADEGDVLAAFADADLASSTDLPPLQLRLHGEDATVQVDWRPDLDDAALLRAALLFAEQPALTLSMPEEPTLRAFCGATANVSAGSVPDPLLPLANELTSLAQNMLEFGMDSRLLVAWAGTWTQACQAAEEIGDTAYASSLALAGAVIGGDRAAALTGLAPLKAEWLAQYLDALWELLGQAEEPDSDAKPTEATTAAVARTTASQHPAYLTLRTQDRPIVPTSEGRLWSLYGGKVARDESGYATTALTDVLGRLLSLQPEAAGHLRCLAWGPGAADLLAAQAAQVIGRKVGGAIVGKIEIFCVGQGLQSRPTWQTLATADDQLRGSRDVLELRYLDTLEDAKRVLHPAGGAPAVHLALVTGITDGGSRLQVYPTEVEPPQLDSEVLFAPRTWQRPRQAGRTLLMPPATTATGQAWLRLQNAVEDSWPEPGDPLRVHEARTGTLDIAAQLKQVHELALWVAMLDRYATRDSLEQALGADEVAILHQERRLGGDSPLSLVLSQKSGGPADRAIGRSLRAAGIVAEPDVAFGIGTDIRKVASQGYGILALEAATSGAGINELVGHCVAFSLLATTTTPWPLPPGCRVLLISLDEYRHWFRGKRADLLAIALDPTEKGVHIAAIEVKARRSDETDAAGGALDQLSQTLAATRWAAYPERGSVHSRLWLNRITEAAYSVARESRFKLDSDEIAALEAFRRGEGTLEWAGVGLVFGPGVSEFHRHYPQEVAGDIVPVALHSIKLTEELLLKATSVRLTELRTVQADAPPLPGGRIRRRPESRPKVEDSDVDSKLEPGKDPQKSDGAADGEQAGTYGGSPVTTAADFGESGGDQAQPPSPTNRDGDARLSPQPQVSDRTLGSVFQAPVLGWDIATGEEVRWHPAGAGQTVLQNGHVEIWGSSGMGKTQFVMSLLAQLAHHSGSRFGIADFKNDYSDETGFPQLAGADFLDLWNGGAPYNPLALDDRSERAIATAVIELRDTVDEATAYFTRMGRRQRAKLESFLKEAYTVVGTENRWPTLRTLDALLDDDLAGVMGDLTRHELFRDGPPLGDVIDRNVVFGLSRIPGNGQTTILAAGFILSSLLLRVQNLPPVPNTVRYVAVVDEAHRVAAFQAIKTMIREGRSKGLAVVLATQQPLDLPDVVAANAQTKICFGLPDATVATMAARKLDPDNPRLAEQIRTLGVGEAFVSLRGDAPRLIKMAQAYRDGVALGIPKLGGE